ncbi:MAG: class I SAM-dependent methyltransferase [Spirochaetaceae bacterium]|nr:class I SAM-dependent methyltransferase [Spirochaetaceae bacterium]
MDMDIDKKNWFNDMADGWDSYARHDMAKVELMIGLLNIKKGDTVLDVGTGTGVLLPLLSRFTNAADITAIDSAEKMIEAAKRKAGNTEIRFITGDALTYPFGESLFDFIICYSVFPHFDGKQTAIRRFGSLLRPGGLLAVLHSESREKINSVHVHAHSFEIKGDRLPTIKEMVEMMGRVKLREEIMIDNDTMYMVCARK